MKRIILCADDYGQNSPISQAIVELLRTKRLSATSCLVTSSEWPSHAKWLEPFKNQADIGLHFNLTEGNPVSNALESFFPLKKIILKSQLGQLNQKAISTELNAQIDLFIDTMNCLPDFIDGHQHIHQFPIVRDALLDVFEKRFNNSSAYLRATYTPGRLLRFHDINYIKQLIIQLCGGIHFKSELAKRNIQHNTSFTGIYDFSKSLEYSKLFPIFLKQIQHGGMIMCHPGLTSTDDESDQILHARQHEYSFLASDAFLDICKSNTIEIVRFKDL